MEGNSPASAPAPIPTRTASQNQGTAQPPAKRQRSSLLQLSGRSFSMPSPYGRGFLGISGSGQRSSNLFTPRSGGPVSPNNLLLPLASPGSSSTAASLDSVKEPEPQSFSIFCPRASPAKVRFPLIDSPEPDSPKSDSATPTTPDIASDTTAHNSEAPARDDETDEEEWYPDNQSANSVALTGSVTRGELESIEREPGTPKSEEGSIVGIPPFPISRETGQNIRYQKTREEYVKYLINKIRKSEFGRGCTTQDWIDNFPNVKAIAQEVADNVYGPRKQEEGQEQKEEGDEKKDKGDKQETRDEKAKECKAKAHRPRPASLSLPQSSVVKGRKFVTRIIKKIKNLFKKNNQPPSQVFEMTELKRVRTNVPKGKEREVVEARPAPAPKPKPKPIPAPKIVVESPGDDAEESVDEGFVKVAPATTPRQIGLDNRAEYREETGETSAQGAKMYCRATRKHADSGLYSFEMVPEEPKEESPK
ncbi:hypothetical protein ABKA04_006419 [Annulohypoxylon sp. FPYF3050]